VNERASELVVAIAKRFIEFALASTTDKWDEAFLRFEGPVAEFKVASIYRAGERSAFFRSDSKLEVHTELADLFGELCAELAKTTGKEFIVALLRVDSEYNYRLFYEYEDSNKWYITKMGGQSGIPVVE
jgi:hypothetical protein